LIGSAHIDGSLTVPLPEEAAAAEREAKLLFQRHLAAWSSDVLALRARGRTALAWSSPSAYGGIWSEAA